MSKKVVALLRKHGPMLSGKLAKLFETEYGVSNTAARQALSRAKSPVNKNCTLSFEKNQKFFYLEDQFMSNRYITAFLDAIKEGGTAPIPSSEILYNQAIIDGIGKSAAVGREIEIDIPEI